MSDFNSRPISSRPFVRSLRVAVGVVLALFPAVVVRAQQPPKAPEDAQAVQRDNALSTCKPDSSVIPEANPARPTVTNPAHIPPVGYVQTEQGILFATASPDGVAQQATVVQTTRISVHPRLMIQLLSQPFAVTRLLPEATGTGQAASSRDAGDLVFGVQGLLALETGARPTVALAYNRRVRAGTAPDLDIGGNAQSAELLVSGDLRHFHYDSNFGVAEQQGLEAVQPVPLRRAQYNQSVSVTHDLGPESLHNDLEITGELWHVTQPLVQSSRYGRDSARSNAVGLLFALGYTVRPNIVLDAGFDHGLTTTSTDWQGFAGVTYLLPHRLWPHTAEAAGPGPHHHHHRR